MVKIAYILLCHKDPEAVIALARTLSDAGDTVTIHLDARAPDADFQRLRKALGMAPNVAFARRRVRCGWGEWSLVRATLVALETALAAFPRATHVYLVSGDCMPIKSHRAIHDMLGGATADHIEAVDFFASGWIKTGLREERLIYRHYVNERARKRLFYGMLRVQKALGLSRRIPDGLQVMIGSQWWCLRRRTAEAVLDYIRRRPDIPRFFRKTWIPDETFFQTLVHQLVPAQELRNWTPTFAVFSDYGVPVTFHDDHHDVLIGQDRLFARKISPDALALRRRLAALYATTRRDTPATGDLRALYVFQTGLGREGLRHAPRFWESGRDRDGTRRLLIVACKKWHVGRRFVARARDVTGIPGVGYLFDEPDADLPALGGIESAIAKRNRHRRSFLRLLFDSFETGRLMICVDISALDAIRDFHEGLPATQILEIDCVYDRAYLSGHAARLGLIGPGTGPEDGAAVTSMIEAQFARERARLGDAAFPAHHRISETATPARNAAALASFFDIAEEKARAIAQTKDLFAD
ncbi:DUF5928 domain-containing protein [Rhodovulum sp. YNF3179]|uniref:DUF5928 domain-containing protein n=1 Tax=Rhodovulum sp. YNF3179 TaxID=3425127 RepID=UPI003D326343